MSELLGVDPEFLDAAIDDMTAHLHNICKQDIQLELNLACLMLALAVAKVEFLAGRPTLDSAKAVLTTYVEAYRDSFKQMAN